MKLGGGSKSRVVNYCLVYLTLFVYHIVGVNSTTV